MNRIHLNFQLRKDRAKTNGLYSIYLYANINGEVKYFTLNHAVTLKAWSEKQQEVSITFPNWNTINDDITRYRTKAEKMRIAADEENEMISMYQFEKIFRNGAKDLKDIFSFIEDDIREFGNTYAKATVKTFESQSRKLKRFREKLKFHEITPLFWKQYNSYLITLNNNENTRWSAFRTMKIFINKAVQSGVIKTDPLKGVIVKKPEGNRMNLTKDEVKKLETLYSGMITKPLKHVLQYFLFSCYTAMRYSDVKNLTHSDIFLNEANPYIQFVQQKTSYPLNLPIGEKILKYLPKKALPGEAVFKVFDNRKTNRLLKDIMKLAGIDKSISYHCSRNTFISIALEESGDIALVSKMAGHKKIASTMIYAKISDNAKWNLTRLMDAI